MIFISAYITSEYIAKNNKCSFGGDITCALFKRSIQPGACTGFLKGVAEATAASEASCSRGAAPRNFLTGLYARPIGYQYRRFKVVD